MKRINIMLSVLIAGLANTVAGQDCARPENIFSFTFQGKRYEIIKELYTWNVASQCAVERGGYLVEINSREEQDTLYQSIVNGVKIPVNYRPVNDGGGTSYVWIGATDKANEGAWIWDGNDDAKGTKFWTGQGLAGTGTGVATEGTYNNWGGASLNPDNPGRRKEPDNYAGSQDFGAMALSVWPASAGGLGIAGEWNDIAGSSNLYFIIEYDTASSVNPEKMEGQIKIFPNPTTDLVTITSSGRNDPVVAVRIYNILGVVVYERNKMRTFELPVDLSEFQSGAYFIQVTLEHGRLEGRKILHR